MDSNLDAILGGVGIAIQRTAVPFTAGSAWTTSTGNAHSRQAWKAATLQATHTHGRHGNGSLRTIGHGRSGVAGTLNYRPGRLDTVRRGRLRIPVDGHGTAGGARPGDPRLGPYWLGLAGTVRHGFMAWRRVVSQAWPAGFARLGRRVVAGKA